MYRKFQLENSLGQKWDLTDHLFKSYLNNPTGLGFSQSIETVQFGNSQNVKTSSTDFPTIGGDVLFWDDRNESKYELYEQFVKFLTYSPLIFKYKKPGNNEVFSLKCVATSLQKTEVKTNSLLTCSISLLGLGMWEGEEREITGTAQTYSINNIGHMPIGFEITLEGSLTAPYITFEQNGDLYGEAKFESVSQFNSVYINSNDGEQNIILRQGDSVLPNPLSYQDLSISNGSIYVTFVKLLNGVSDLTIGMDSGSLTGVNIKYTPRYRSV